MLSFLKAFVSNVHNHLTSASQRDLITTSGYDDAFSVSTLAASKRNKESFTLPILMGSTRTKLCK